MRGHAMRLFAKVLLLGSLVALTVLVLVLVGRWGPAGKGRTAAPERPAATGKPRPAPARDDRPAYDDPLSRFERFRSDVQPPPVRRDPHDLESSAQDEGAPKVRDSDEPVLGADPPGPVLRPSGAPGTIITDRWRPERRDAEAKNVYVVQQGDTLYGIAVDRYGDAKYVPMIEAANPGISARSLPVGHRLVLPDAEAPQAERVAPPAPKEEKVYVVRKSDTLIGIARRFYGDASMYRRIYEANRDVLKSPTAPLYVGQRLRMPEGP